MFALRDIDLTKLESRPARGLPWEYVFYADIGAARADVRCGRAIVHLAEFARWVRTLGSYPRWTGSDGHPPRTVRADRQPGADCEKLTVQVAWRHRLDPVR